MFNFKVVSMVATGSLLLVAGSYAIADIKVEVEATNAEGFKLEIEVEGTSLGFIDATDNTPPSFSGDLTGKVELTDPLGNECEVDIVRSINGIALPPAGFQARLSLFSVSGPPVLSIFHDDSMSVSIPPPSTNRFAGLGCVSPSGAFIIRFPGELTKVEIKDS